MFGASPIFLPRCSQMTRMQTVTRLKDRIPLFVWFFTLSALLFLGASENERDDFRSDILSFYGDQKITADSLTSDSFLVTLTCKTAQSTQIPSKYSIVLRGLDAVEKALLQDAQFGKWERFDLFRAAMIVEGIRDPELIRIYEARLNALVAKTLDTARAEGNTSPKAVTQLLFEAMHRELLTKPYDLHCTELSKVMATGHFNCVSATVLFNCLAEKAGLDVCALETPGHALSQVRFDDGVVMNIETTSPIWFKLQTDKERQMAMRERVATPVPAQTNPLMAQNAVAPPEVAALPEPTVAGFREINPVQLIATIYYNEGVDLHAKKRYPEAVAANVKALYLDKENGQAWTNLIASLNNWALELMKESGGQKYYAASAILDQGVVIDPTYTDFKSNQQCVFYYWIRGLAEKGQFDTARQVYDHSQERLPADESLQKLISKVNQMEAEIMQQRR